jgi:hypothetical protein
MSNRCAAGRPLAAAGLLFGLLAACAPAGSAPIPLPTIALTESPRFVPVPTATLPSPSPTATAEPPPATAGAAVQVTATGNVNIRRGPDLAFNSIAILPKGAVITATGRDVLSNWVRIPIPEDTSRTGWISIMSQFTQVVGDMDSLPEIDPKEWPELASLRNCTYHELWIEPIGVTLPPVFEFPNNDVRLNPGIYSVLDVEIDGYPEVLKVDLGEGMTIDVLVDGLGEKKKCPPP